jgi:hypothetical protein
MRVTIALGAFVTLASLAARATAQPPEPPSFSSLPREARMHACASLLKALSRRPEATAGQRRQYGDAAGALASEVFNDFPVVFNHDQAIAAVNRIAIGGSATERARLFQGLLPEAARCETLARELRAQADQMAMRLFLDMRNSSQASGPPSGPATPVATPPAPAPAAVQPTAAMGDPNRQPPGIFTRQKAYSGTSMECLTQANNRLRLLGYRVEGQPVSNLVGVAGVDGRRGISSVLRCDIPGRVVVIVARNGSVSIDLVAETDRIIEGF